MKRIIKKILLRGGAPLFKKLGLVPKAKINVGAQKLNLLHTFYGILNHVNFYPKHIIDVGANHGTWSREILEFFPKAQITMLEPQHWLKPSVEELLQNKNVKLFNVGAGDKNATLKFTIVDRDDSCNFRITSEEAQARGFKQVDVPIVTLNSLVKDNQLSIPDLLKIDAEGIDLKVLEGASDFLGITEIILVEAAVNNNVFDNTFLKVINYMEQKNYRLFEITDLNRPFPNQALWLVEIVFILKGGKLDKHSWRE